MAIKHHLDKPILNILQVKTNHGIRHDWKWCSLAKVTSSKQGDGDAIVPLKYRSVNRHGPLFKVIAHRAVTFIEFCLSLFSFYGLCLTIYKTVLLASVSICWALCKAQRIWPNLPRQLDLRDQDPARIHPARLQVIYLCLIYSGSDQSTFYVELLAAGAWFKLTCDG